MSKTIKIPYGRSFLTLPDDLFQSLTILEAGAQRQAPAQPAALLQKALENPIGSQRLSQLAQGCERVLVLTSDHTRPLPSRLTLPPLLHEIRLNNPNVQIRILVATGYHRQTRPDELLEKFGRELLAHETFQIHDCHKQEELVYKGLLPSGGELWLNRAVDWADLVVAEGFIEPHFFAGFSGGRKSLMPGIAGAQTVLANHCAEFIASPFARTGQLAHNPIHKDMVYAARQVPLAFISNVLLDANQNITAAFAGDLEQAHEAGCRVLDRVARVRQVEADLVITSNGGYPLDQNIYQAVKGMTAAEACVRPGGVIIMVAACEDGTGGEAFYRWFQQAPSPRAVSRAIASRSRQDTLPDQWQAQILARVLERATVILVTDRCDPETVERMHLRHASNLDQAIGQARQLLADWGQAVVIPDGVGVIVRRETSTP